MAYSQLQKEETKVYINSSAEKFYDVFCNRPYHIPKLCNEKIQAVNIHKGEWGSEGSIISWNYINDGKAGVAKDVVEGIDKKNNKMSFKVIEGDLLGDFYKSFKFVLEVIPKGNGSEVHWVIEYEKQNENIPDPHTMSQLLFEITKNIDGYITKDQK
ncbi:hypothetical protein VNO77_26945 [Canavalia gladiata]|uniref:Bet v I/Major latex protein domain-containing protein n=1 Tax=Canavalia gladiata TaxID=3824 RepID=A0AAN9KUX3_CANGL